MYKSAIIPPTMFHGEYYTSEVNMNIVVVKTQKLLIITGRYVIVNTPLQVLYGI